MPPDFFLDRNLGTRTVPEALRAAGWNVTTLADVFGEHPGQRVADEHWLRYVGEHGLAVLTKDERIRYRDVERAALVRHGVVVFCLTNARLTGAQQAERFIKFQQRIFSLASVPGPAIHMVSATSLRRVPEI